MCILNFFGVCGCFALFEIQGGDKKKFSTDIEGELFKINGKDPEIKSEKEAEELKNRLLSIKNYYSIEDISKKQTYMKDAVKYVHIRLYNLNSSALRYALIFLGVNKILVGLIASCAS